MKTKKCNFLFSILLYLFLVLQNSVQGQWLTTGNVTGGGEKLGSSSGLFDLNFYIDNNMFLQLLTSGNLNIVPNNRGYMIDNDYVLRHNNIKSSIYLGVGAGNSNLNPVYNTFVGFNSGANNGNSWANLGESSRNTFVGHLAGFSNDQGRVNSFFGDSAGYNNIGSSTDGYHNTFLGASTGWTNISGKSNTLVGFECGYNNLLDYNTMVGRACGRNAVGSSNSFFGKDVAQSLIGIGNSCFGAHASDDVTAGGNNYICTFGLDAGRYANGESNCFFGHGAGTTIGGFSWTGYKNSFFGAESGKGANITGATSMSYSGGFGFKAIATSSYKIIIGTNKVYTEQIHVGIGLSDDQSIYLGPRSPLEINSDPNSTEVGSGVGITGSGLQFRQLTSASPNNANTYIAPYGRVLTVDATGRVLLTDAKSDIGYGLCPNPTSLTGDIGMKMRDYNLYYDGQAYTGRDNKAKNAIGLGYVCSTDLPGKLSVDQTFTSSSVDYATIAGYFHNGDITSNSPNHYYEKRSLYSICDGYSNLTEEYGITNVAGDFVATNSEYTNIGVRGRTGIHSPVSTYGQFGFGGYFDSYKSKNQNIGVYAGSDGSGSVLNYGIYASCPIGSCGTSSCSDAAGYFNGDVYTTSSAYFTSDQNLKKDIQPIQNSLSIINALSPKTYNFRTNQFPFLNLPSGIQDGLIAQEVQAILPQLVSSFKVPARIDSTGALDTTGTSSSFMAVNYVGIIPYLVGAIKEQQESIDSLRNQLQDAISLINNCCGANQRRSSNNHSENDNNSEDERSNINVELSDVNSIILDQNSPNPFNEETVINFVIPEEVSKALILIYDNKGNILKTIMVNERGPGSLHIYAEKLSSGVYSYSLIADGKTIDTKRMVCQK